MFHACCVSLCLVSLKQAVDIIILLYMGIHFVIEIETYIYGVFIVLWYHVMNIVN